MNKPSLNPKKQQLTDEVKKPGLNPDGTVTATPGHNVRSPASHKRALDSAIHAGSADKYGVDENGTPYWSGMVTPEQRKAHQDSAQKWREFLASKVGSIEPPALTGTYGSQTQGQDTQAGNTDRSALDNLGVAFGKTPYKTGGTQDKEPPQTPATTPNGTPAGNPTVPPANTPAPTPAPDGTPGYQPNGTPTGSVPLSEKFGQYQMVASAGGKPGPAPKTPAGGNGTTPTMDTVAAAGQKTYSFMGKTYGTEAEAQMASNAYFTKQQGETAAQFAQRIGAFYDWAKENNPDMVKWCESNQQVMLQVRFRDDLAAGKSPMQGKQQQGGTGVWTFNGQVYATEAEAQAAVDAYNEQRKLPDYDSYEDKSKYIDDLETRLKEIEAIDPEYVSGLLSQTGYSTVDELIATYRGGNSGYTFNGQTYATEEEFQAAMNAYFGEEPQKDDYENEDDYWAAELAFIREVMAKDPVTADYLKEQGYADAQAYVAAMKQQSEDRVAAFTQYSQPSPEMQAWMDANANWKDPAARVAYNELHREDGTYDNYLMKMMFSGQPFNIDVTAMSTNMLQKMLAGAEQQKADWRKKYVDMPDNIDNSAASVLGYYDKYSNDYNDEIWDEDSYEDTYVIDVALSQGLLRSREAFSTMTPEQKRNLRITVYESLSEQMKQSGSQIGSFIYDKTGLYDKQIKLYQDELDYRAAMDAVKAEMAGKQYSPRTDLQAIDPFKDADAIYLSCAGWDSQDIHEANGTHLANIGQFLTQDEKNAYMYLYDTHGPDYAKDWLQNTSKLYSRTTTLMDMEQAQKTGQHATSGWGVLDFAAARVATLANAIMGPAQAILAATGDKIGYRQATTTNRFIGNVGTSQSKAISDWVKEGNLEPFLAAMGLPTIIHAAMGGDFSDITKMLTTTDSVTGKTAVEWMYDAVVSGVDSTLAFYTGAMMCGITGNDVVKLMGVRQPKVAAAVTGLMSSEAFSSELHNNILSGMDPMEAIKRAAISAGIEGLTEIWSVEMLMGDPKGGIALFAKIIGAEGLEEVAGGIADTLASIMYGDDPNSVLAKAQNYLEEIQAQDERDNTNKPYAVMCQEALSRAWAEEGVSWAWQGAAGSFSSLFNATAATARAHRNVMQTGRNVAGSQAALTTTSNTGAQALADMANQYVSEHAGEQSAKKITKILNKLNGNKMQTGSRSYIATLGALEIQMEEALGEAVSQPIADTMQTIIAQDMTEVLGNEPETQADIKKYAPKIVELQRGVMEAVEKNVPIVVDDYLAIMDMMPGEIRQYAMEVVRASVDQQAAENTGAEETAAQVTDEAVVEETADEEQQAEDETAEQPDVQEELRAEQEEAPVEEAPAEQEVQEEADAEEDTEDDGNIEAEPVEVEVEDWQTEESRNQGYEVEAAPVEVGVEDWQTQENRELGATVEAAPVEVQVEDWQTQEAEEEAERYRQEQEEQQDADEEAQEEAEEEDEAETEDTSDTDEAEAHVKPSPKSAQDVAKAAAEAVDKVKKNILDLYTIGNRINNAATGKVVQEAREALERDVQAAVRDGVNQARVAAAAAAPTMTINGVRNDTNDHTVQMDGQDFELVGFSVEQEDVDGVKVQVPKLKLKGADGTVQTVEYDPKSGAQNIRFGSSGVYQIVADATNGNQAMSTDAYNAMLAAYQGGSATDFINQFTDIYNAAYDNRAVPEEHSAISNELADVITQAAQADARNQEQQRKANVARGHSAHGTFTVSETVKNMKLTAEQSTVIDALGRISEAVPGLSVNIIASEDHRVQGAYQNNTVTLNLLANNFRNVDGHLMMQQADGKLVNATGTILLNIAGHELTHFIEANSTDEYISLVNAVRNYMGNENFLKQVAAHQNTYNSAGQRLTRGGAISEVVADACSNMLLDTNAITELANRDKNLFERIKSWVQDWFGKVSKIWNHDARYTPGVELMQDTARKDGHYYAESVIRAWDAGLIAAAENIQTEMTQEEADQRAEEGVNVVEELHSLAAFTNDYDVYQQMLRESGVDELTIQNLFNTVDAIMDRVAQDPDILDFVDDWKDRTVTPVKDNSDAQYVVSLDFSTLCRKRLLQQAVVTELTRQLDRVPTREEQIAIRNKLIALRDIGLNIDVACGLCFVESARLKGPEQMRRFFDDRLKVATSYYAKRNSEYMQNVVEPAAAKWLTDHGYAPDTKMSDLKTRPKNQLTALKQGLYAKYEMTEAEKAAAERILGIPAHVFTDGNALDNLRRHDAEVANIFNEYLRNATKSKGLSGDVSWSAGEYKEAITEGMQEKLNSLNGTRTQTWSDFQVYHTLDYMAMVIELSTRKAMMQSYTKVPAFVRLMGKTGIMINCSMIPSETTDGTLAFDPHEGMPKEVADELRRLYPDTVGNISIGITDDQIIQLLESDDFDMVIPYHASSLSKGSQRQMGLMEWINYTKWQNETTPSGKAASSGVKFAEWYTYEKAKGYQQDYLRKHPDASLREASNAAMDRCYQDYLKVCKDRNLKAKFARFSDVSGAWKLLVDHKMINQETGDLIQQQAVQPNFDRETILQIMQDEVDGFKQTQLDKATAIGAVLDDWGNIQKASKAKAQATQIKNLAVSESAAVLRETYSKLGFEVMKRQSETKFSIATDAEYMDAVNRGDMDAARTMVTNAAMNAGYTPVVRYHQTGNRFNKFNTDNPVAGLNDSQTPNGIFFKENDHDIGVGGDWVKTGRGGPIQMEVFLKSDNMLHFKDRNDATAWYDKNVPGYADLRQEYERVSKPLSDRMEALEDKYFFDEAIEKDEFDKQWNTMLDELRQLENKYHRQMRGLLDEYFLKNDSGYDGIELDYDGHRYIDGKRENVHTFIVFDPTQVKSADPVTYDDAGKPIPLSQRFDTGNEDIRYSVYADNYQFVNTFDDNLNTLKQGGNLGVDDIVIGQTPKVLRDIGVLNKLMAIDQSHTKGALLGTNDTQHTMSINKLKRVIKQMNDPIAIIASDSHPNNSVVVIVDEVVNGNHVVVPVQVSTQGRKGNARIAINRMSSAYGKENIELMIRTAFAKQIAGNGFGIYYWNNEKANNLRGKGLQLPSSSKINGVVHMITDNPDFVKQSTEGVIQESIAPLTEDQQKNADFNMANHDVGSRLKTLAGTDIKRYKGIAGKQVGSQVYVHADYADQVIPADVLAQAKDILAKEMPGFQYKCLMYDGKAGKVRFDQAPDFDTAREPIPGDTVTVDLVTDEITAHKYYDAIWHHKWLWVQNDYSGFDVAQSWEWSKQWLSTIRKTDDAVSNRGIANGTGHGTTNWNKQLDYFGLPHDESSSQRQYSLRAVDPVEPTSGMWQRGHTEAWFRENGFPIYQDVPLELQEVKRDTKKKGHGTQISTTTSTYRQLFEKLQQDNPTTWQNMRILDASSGLGLGTQLGREMGFNVTDIEPFPNDSYKPNYTDYSRLESEVENGETEGFDFIISNAVLNVVPQDTRDQIAVAMGHLLKPGGRMYVNVISKNYDTAIKSNPDIEDAKARKVTARTMEGDYSEKGGVKGRGHEIFVWSSNSVQKVFSSNELKAYLEDALGNGYTVTPFSKFGMTAAWVEKSTQDSQLSLSPSAELVDSLSSSAELLANLDDGLLNNQAEINAMGLYREQYAKYAEIVQKYNEQLQLSRDRSLSEAEREQAKNRAEIYYQQMVRENEKLMQISRRTSLNNVRQRVDRAIGRYMTGRNADQVKAQVEELEQNVRDMRAEIGDTLRRMQNGEAGANAKAMAMFNRETLDMIAETIISETGSNIRQGLLAKALAPIYMAMSQNEVDTAEVEAMIDRLVNSVVKESRYQDTDGSWLFGTEAEARAQIDTDRMVAKALITSMFTAYHNELVSREASKAMQKELRHQLTKSLHNTERAEAMLNEINEKLDAALGKLGSIWAGEARNVADMRLALTVLKSNTAATIMSQQIKAEERLRMDRELRETAVEIAKSKRAVRKIVKDLTNKYRSGDNYKNIPEQYRQLVNTFLTTIAMHDEGGRGVAYDKKQAAKLLQQYKAMQAEDARYDGMIFDTEMQESIQALSEALADVTALGNLRSMEAIQNQLLAWERIRDVAEFVHGIAKHGSDVFLANKRSDTSTVANGFIDKHSGDPNKRMLVGGGSFGSFLDTMKSFTGWGNLTPEYFFRMINDETMTGLQDTLREGENKYGKRMGEAYRFLEETSEKWKRSEWNDKQKITFHINQGTELERTMELTLQQAMSVYATWVREHTKGQVVSQHLEHGGIVLAQNKHDGRLRFERAGSRSGNRINVDAFDEIKSQLSENVIGYINDVVGYLSNDMSVLGNQASMEMYGIRKYKEQYYFPIKSSRDTMFQRSDAAAQSTTDDSRMKNQGFTKSRLANANNAVLIEDFDQVTSGHIQQMVTYSSFVTGLESMNRVLNYSWEDEEGVKHNIRSMFAEKYGEDAKKYLQRFIADMNGGVGSSTGTGLEKWLGWFRKNAVAGSLSVAAQQPLSFIRAAYAINPIYLATSYTRGIMKQGAYKEMMKYSGLAQIKAMGRFDASLGRSALEYLSGAWEKTSVKTVADKIFNGLPTYMDEITWTQIWRAVKMEQMAKHKGMNFNSDAFLNIVAERFNEIIRTTQVYDSVMVRSQTMRNKDHMSKVLTSFMAEPTLTLNMLYDSVFNGKKSAGKRAEGIARAFGAFFISAIAQAAVKGLMGAGRKDDKKLTLWEQFLQKFYAQLLSQANPLSSFPGYDNLVDILSGKDITDDTWSAVKNAVSGLLSLTDGLLHPDKMSTVEGVYKYAEDSLAQLVQLFTDIPLKNVMRDLRAVINMMFNVSGYVSPLGGNVVDREASQGVIKFVTEEGALSNDFMNIINYQAKEMGLDKPFETKVDAYASRLYEMMKAGDENTAAELRDFMTLYKLTGDDPNKTLYDKVKKLAQADVNADKMTVEEAALMLYKYLPDTKDFDTIMKNVKDAYYTNKRDGIKADFIGGRMTLDAAVKLLMDKYPYATNTYKFTRSQLVSAWEKATGKKYPD